MDQKSSNSYSPVGGNHMAQSIAAPSGDPPAKSTEEEIRDTLSQFERLSADIQRDALEVQRRTLRWTRGIVVVTGIYTAFAAFQWWTMRGQLDSMNKTGDDTHTLAEAAKKQADATLRLVNATDRTALSAGVTCEPPLSMIAP